MPMAFVSNVLVVSTQSRHHTDKFDELLPFINCTLKTRSSVGGRGIFAFQWPVSLRMRDRSRSGVTVLRPARDNDPGVS